MISVPMIILGEILYGSADLGTGHVRYTHTHRAPEDKPGAAFGFYLEDSAGGVFMSSKAILHAMDLDPGVEDAESEPVEVVVEGGDVVDVEVHRGRSRGGRRVLLRLGAAAAMLGGGR